MVSTKIDTRLEIRGEDNPVETYPDVSAGEMDRLEWYVGGELCIEIDGKIVTSSPYSEEGYLHDYL